jgi:hypothetical protein
MGLSALNDKWNGNLDAPTVVVILCSGISLFNALELLLLVLITFKAWKGLYFWSLFIASSAVIPYSVGYLVVFFGQRYGLVGDVINNIGWIVMVTGQSVVLYSRLHLILHDQRILRSVKWMIVINAVVFYVPTTITHYGTYSHSGGFNSAFQVIEKFQMTGFCVQEFIISALYMKEVWRFLKIVTQEGTRRTMWELLLINMIIVLLDIGLLVMEYLDLRIFEQTFKGVAYSVKLKMELAILGKLVTMAQSGNRVIMGNGDLEGSGSPGGHTISREVSHGTSSALEAHSSIVKEY